MTTPDHRHDEGHPKGGGGSLASELVVVSDIHLRHLDDRRGELLLDLLGRLDAKVECLVLNGDIFDFCFGAGAFFQRKFSRLGRRLSALANRGTRVVFIEGNHEYHLAAVGWHGVEIMTSGATTVALKSGVRIFIAHGDLLTRDPWYAAFRTVTKSKLAQFGARCVPGPWLDAYALRHAVLSRRRDRYRSLDHERILSALEHEVVAAGADHGIIGHFHVPYAERRQGGNGLLLCVDSWDKPNVLAYESEPGRPKFARAFLLAAGAPFCLQSTEPLFRTGTGMSGSDD